MYSRSFFILPPGEQHFKYHGNEASPITVAFAKTNDVTTVLTLSCSEALVVQIRKLYEKEPFPLFYYTPSTVSIMANLEQFDKVLGALYKLKNHHFIATDFARAIANNYPNQRGGVMQWCPAVPETEAMCMDISDDGQEEEPEQASKRRRLET